MTLEFSENWKKNLPSTSAVIYPFSFLYRYRPTSKRSFSQIKVTNRSESVDNDDVVVHEWRWRARRVKLFSNCISTSQLIRYRKTGYEQNDKKRNVLRTSPTEPKSIQVNLLLVHQLANPFLGAFRFSKLTANTFPEARNKMPSFLVCSFFLRVLEGKVTIEI